MPRKTYSRAADRSDERSDENPDEKAEERGEFSQGEINELLKRLVDRIHSEASSERADSTASDTRRPSGLSLDEFLQTATESVLRAVDAREKRLADERGDERAQLHLRVPLIFGYVLGPVLSQGGADTEPKREK